MTLNEVIHRLQEQEMQSPAYRIGAAVHALHSTLSELRSLQLESPELMKQEGDLLTARDMLNAIIGGVQ